jgi:hypothetical protein
VVRNGGWRRMEGACLKRAEVGGARGRLLDASLTLLRSAPVENWAARGKKRERRPKGGDGAASVGGRSARGNATGRWR